jgi:hypothetical protein
MEGQKRQVIIPVGKKLNKNGLRDVKMRTHVDAPLVRVEPEGLQSPTAAEVLQLVHHFRPAVVTLTRVALGVPWSSFFKLLKVLGRLLKVGRA